MKNFPTFPIRFRKGEPALALDSIKRSFSNDPAMKRIHLAILNSKLDLALHRISEEEHALSLKNPDRAIVRMDAQTRAYAAGSFTI